MFRISWINTLQNAKSSSSNAAVRNIARSIWQRGNGQQRVVVSGFTSPNVDLKDVMENNALLLRYGYRFAVKGFNNANVGTAPHKCGFFQKIRFFPNFNIPRMRRHVVYDIPTQRTVIQGFQQNISEVENVTDSVISNGTNQIRRGDLLAKERIVIQGFTPNSSSEPVKKAIDFTNSKSRVIIKGFMA